MNFLSFFLNVDPKRVGLNLPGKPAKMIAELGVKPTIARMSWLRENSPWLFSGVLVAVPLAVVGWILKKRHSAKSQKQVGGDNSVNVQVGGNVQIGRSEPDDRADPKGRE